VTGAPSETLRITVPAADMDVAAVIDGDPSSMPLLVFGHGAGAGIEHLGQQALAGALVTAGIATLRYHFPFMERLVAKGATRFFGRDSLPVAVATVRAAVAVGAARAERGLFAGGHSYGGRMTTHAAAEAGGLPGVGGLVLLSFPLHGAGKPETERARHLPAIERPMLFVSGDRDALAQTPWLEDCIDALPEARLVRVAGADHGWRTARRAWPEGPFAAMAGHVADWLREH